MKRPHLFEFLDQPWYPSAFRNLQTDTIQHATGSDYDGVVPLITRVLRQAGTTQVLDLCSGAGGPRPKLQPLVEAEDQHFSVKLSDKLPLVPLIFVVMYWFLVTRLKPVTLPRVLFTYLIPLVPLATAWDYVVSGLRAYTQQELEEMVGSIKSDGYTWEVGQITSGRLPITYLLGYLEAGETATR